MEKPSLVFSDFALRRMSARGLAVYHILYCLNHQKGKYNVGKDTVWVCELPDGRNIKVRVQRDSESPIIVKDAFTFRRTS